MLIVEDDADFASVVAEVGQNHGFTSLICSTGEQGLDALRREHFAAVILDILLPDISGWQVHRELRADERHQGMPVIIISACRSRMTGTTTVRAIWSNPWHRPSWNAFSSSWPAMSTTRRLLLVETDPRRRMLIRDYFERLGYSVTLAATAEAARLAPNRRSPWWWSTMS